jgi:chromosome segregation ATPase
MGIALDQAITRSAEESSRAISAAFAVFGDKFDTASEGLIRTLATTAGRMETLAGAIERSTGAAGDHATKLADAGREAQGIATLLGSAANDMQSAAAPIREATSSIGQALVTTQDVVRATSERAERSEAAMQGVTDGLTRTSDAATRAWDGYRDRFEDVDQALARALEQIKGASAEHASELNTQVGRIDSALAQAVGRLEGSLAVLEDLANALEDVREKFQTAAV